VVTLNKSTEIIPKEEEVKGEQIGERERAVYGSTTPFHCMASIQFHSFIHSSSLSFDHQT